MHRKLNHKMHGKQMHGKPNHETRSRVCAGMQAALAAAARSVAAPPTCLGRAAGHARSRAAGALFALFFALSVVPRAWAASSFGDMADNVKDELTRFGPLLQAGFALGGFFLVGLGLWQLWAKSQQPGAPKGGAIIAILIGCGLLGAATIAQMGSGTLGTGTPELSEIGL